jgi:hypothetical protein
MKEITIWPDVVVHSYNFSHLGGRDQEDPGSKAAQAEKKFVAPHLNKQARGGNTQL